MAVRPDSAQEAVKSSIVSRSASAVGLLSAVVFLRAGSSKGLKAYRESK